MGKTRKKHDAAFKSREALEAVKGEKPITQLVSEYRVHPNQTGQWKKKLLEDLPRYFQAVRRWKIMEGKRWRLRSALVLSRAIESALLLSKPEIFNTDQDSQFTSDDFTGLLKLMGIRISMDGRGRAPVCVLSHSTGRRQTGISRLQNSG